MDENYKETRQERRERKLTSKRERVRKHGRNLAQLYKAAIAKRINKLRSDKGKGREPPA
ncbi:MAG: hypothetical protein JW762_04555 [Dehalococcoidales bacterium]|nr:hypothetical protein [Dehalococcoidales bacterium]